MKFTELTEKEYEKYLENYDNKNFLQSLEIGRVNQTLNNEVCYLGIKKGSKILCASLFIIKKNIKNNRKYYYCPRGFQIDYQNDELLNYYIAELIKHAKNNNAYLIKIDPNIELYSRDSEGNKTDLINNYYLVDKLCNYGFIYLNQSIQKKWFYVLDLKNKTKEDVFNNFRSTVKNIIRKCQKNGIEIEELNDNLSRFSSIVEETANRKKFAVRDEDYYLLMKNEFKDKIKILIAKIDLAKYEEKLSQELAEMKKNESKIKGEGKIKNHLENIENLKINLEKIKDIKNKYGNLIDLAASMFCFYGNEIVYLFSGSKEEFLFLNAPYLIQWEIIQEAIDKGYSIYNFYGIEDLSDSKNKKHGVYEFKKGFNGRVVETIGEMDLYLNIIDKLKYYLKKIIKKN